MHELKGNWLNTCWCRVLLLEGPKLSVEAEINLAGAFVKSDVSGPQLFVCLSHHSDGVSNCASSNGLVAGGESVVS
jgi:hypothetical protein